MAATILHLGTGSSGYIGDASLDGIRRYACSLRWNVVEVPPADSRPDRLSALFFMHRPVVGCIVECSGGRRDLPPRRFGAVPVVYMHADPSLYGGRGLRVGYDDAAIAEAAFRELSDRLPAAFAVVPFAWPPGRRGWSLRRERAFAALASASGKPLFRLPWRNESKERREARLVRWLASLPRHTAIFAVGDLAAIETAAAVRRCHRSIPRELTLLGVDSNPALCEASRPTLSSIQIDHELAGYLAAKAIGDVLATKNTKKHKGYVNSVSSVADKNSVNLVNPVKKNSIETRSAEILVKPLLAVRRESTGGFGRREPFVLEAMETIRREACEGLTVAKLAKRFRCSRPLFDRRFREAVGHSPLEEILHVRLEKVFTLLSRTDVPVGAVADFCGFRSNIALHSLFKKRTGMSMSEWRRRNRHQ